MSQGPPPAQVARVRDALDDVVAAHGCDLEEVELTSAGTRSKLTVAVDRDGGVDLDTIAELSREISERLDQLDLINGTYTLDVGSRGVHRPLVEPRHWRRNAGRLVKVDLTDGSSVTGRLVEIGDGEVTLEPRADPRFHSTKTKPPIVVGLDAVKQAMVEVDFRALSGVEYADVTDVTDVTDDTDDDLDDTFGPEDLHHDSQEGQA